MARIGRILPAVVVTGGNPAAVNDSPFTSTGVGSVYDLSGQLGAVLRTNDGLKEWIYVKLDSTSTGRAPAVGHLCHWWSSTATSTGSGVNKTWTVDNSTAGNAANMVSPAGVLYNAATRGNYVWLLRKASSTVVASTATKAGVIGVAVVISSTQSGDPTVVISTATDPSVGNQSYPQIGILNSISTAASVSGATSTSGYSVFLDVNLSID